MKKKATIYLPKKGKQKWTEIMEGLNNISEDILPFQPIVMSTTVFEDGVVVVGGVLKSESPEDYNLKFFYVFDKKGNRIPNVIDPSDDEDFRESKRVFYLDPEEMSDKYILSIKEKKS